MRRSKNFDKVKRYYNIHIGSIIMSSMCEVRNSMEDTWMTGIS